MKKLLASLILFWFVATSMAQTPTVVHCTVNAKASRGFAEDIGWYGPHPERDDVRDSWEQPDASKPFQVNVMPSEVIFFSQYIFSQLDTEHPHVRAIFNPDLTPPDGEPRRGYEREATVIRRTPFAIFFFWEGAPVTIYSVVLHLDSLKAAIGGTSSGALVTIGVSGITADCL